MNIFIAGPRAIRKVDRIVLERINNMIDKGYTILLGDANGVDRAIQCHLKEKQYTNVRVYASEGRARNNIGNWGVQKVEVPKSVRGFEFYAAKDYEMAKAADYGLMIWNGQSKGTLNNSINLLSMGKNLMIYFTPERMLYTIQSLSGLQGFVEKCDGDTQKLLTELLVERNIQMELSV